jgi:hypothetical protein
MTPAGMSADPHLRARLAWLSSFVRRVVTERMAVDPDPHDPYRGLYVSDGEATELAQRDGEAVDESALDDRPLSLAVPDDDSRLAVLASGFGLDALDLDLLVIAVATELEPRFEKLYGYLHDDLTRRRPSVGLAMELTGHGFGEAAVRARLRADGSLVKYGLVLVEEPARPFLTRPLRVADRVIAHLLGDDAIDVELARLRIPSVVIEAPEAAMIAATLAAGVTPVYVQDDRSGVGAAVGATALALGGLDAMTADLALLSPDDDPLAVARGLAREARLGMCGLVVMLDDDRIDEHRAAVSHLADAQWPMVIVGSHPWDPAWATRPVVSHRALEASSSVPMSVWTSCLPELDGTQLRLSTRQFRLRPDQIVHAATLAERRAHAEGRVVSVDDVAAGARAQNSSRLERLAKRINSAVEWEDLVLPVDILGQLRELADRYANRDLVHGDWGMGGKANRRVGVVALFAGPSGVGKTMAAEALAHSLRLDLYQVNLATVVDKYIGETEKNLERIFVAAEGVNGVIFFDEADALFGKRSEVSDAKDRYANVEVAYLLQRLESFGGVAVLATNLRTNVDDAFTRRLDALIDFPEPDAGLRRALWDRCIGHKVPRADSIDIDFLADRFRLSGGNIRNIAVSAAFLAAARSESVGMADLVLCTAREYRKLGRLCTAGEFGPWLDLALGRGPAPEGPGSP